MNGRRKLLVAVVLAAALLASVAAVAPAADPARPELALSVEVRKEAYVKDADGKEKLEWREAGDVRPGDILKYTIAYRKRRQVRGALRPDRGPRPEGGPSTFRAARRGRTQRSRSASMGRASGSRRCSSKRSAGRTGPRVSGRPLSETYTHIQWTLLKAVPPGGGGAVSFKVRVK